MADFKNPTRIRSALREERSPVFSGLINILASGENGRVAQIDKLGKLAGVSGSYVYSVRAGTCNFEPDKVQRLKEALEQRVQALGNNEILAASARSVIEGLSTLLPPQRTIGADRRRRRAPAAAAQITSLARSGSGSHGLIGLPQGPQMEINPNEVAIRMGDDLLLVTPADVDLSFREAPNGMKIIRVQAPK